MGKGSKPRQSKDQILQQLDRNSAERVAAHREAARLIKTGVDAEVVTVEIEEDGVKRHATIVRASRKSCFDTLLADGSVERLATDWLQETISTANGENTPERRPDHIRASSSGPPGQNISDHQLTAHDILTVVQELTPPREMRMIYDLMKPEYRTCWRERVEKHTGVKNPHAQSDRVKSAAGRLAFLKDNITRLMRDRRDRRQAA